MRQRLLLPALVAAIMAVPGAHAFDLQGHRGARGLAPENTLVAFARALEIGVTTLETDLAVTSDGVLVLSHDPVLNPDIVRNATGRWLAAPGPAINTLTLAELKVFDVGRIDPSTRYARTFPEQKSADGTPIPTLAELFALVRRSAKSVRLNIETKISPDRPSETPDPESFARLVVDAVRASDLTAHATIQSFDWRTLLAARRLAPEIETVCLTTANTLLDAREGARRVPSRWLAGLDPDDHGRSPARLSNAAGCRVWSPRYPEVTPAQVAEAHALGLKVIPWTVNDPSDLARSIDMKVDGLITDYPDRARKVMADKGIPLP